jgi:hypothetical protein
VTVEVVEQNMSVFTNVTKVDALASALEEQQAIKVLKQSGVWLMDCAKNRLSSRS